MAEIINASELLYSRVVLNRWVFKGKADSLSLLIENYSPGQDGYVYLVGDDVYTWDVDTASFVHIGYFRGPVGERGPRGEGTTIYYGDGYTPNSSVGLDEDLYINHVTDLINGVGYRGLYRKTKGVWNRIIDLSVSTVSTIGMLAFFADPSLVPKRGWLPVTGGDVGRIPYAGLFSLMGTTFGAGDGSTTFTLPDARARFLRSLDLNCGFDLGREFGSFQDCAIEDFTGTFGKTLLLSGGSASGVFSISDIEKTPYTNTGGSDRWGNISINASNIAKTSAETRPVNIAFPLYICYM